MSHVSPDLRGGAASAEPDRAEGFPAPRETEALFGHDKAEAELTQALHAARMHHAWLVVGPEGVGKATLAYRIARQALALNDPSTSSGHQMKADHPVFRKVAALAHPNLLVLRRPWDPEKKRYRKEITVDEVRRLRSFLGTTGAQRGWRVVIVDRADELNQNAANALLKVLEEPPPQTLFLLIASAEGRLPVTVRSRCRVLRLDPLGRVDLERAVSQALRQTGVTVEEERLASVLALAQGSVRRALELVTGDGVRLYDEILASFAQLPDLDAKGLHKFAEDLARHDAERIELFFSLLLDLMQRLVRHAATGEGAIGEEGKIAERLVRPGSLARWAELWETIARAKAESLALNLDRGILVLETFFRLEQFTRSQRA